jgi:hypothetical protein
MIAKTLKGKISQEAYIAVLEVELATMHSIAETNAKYDGVAAMAMFVGATASMHGQIMIIVRDDKSKRLDGDSCIVGDLK